MKNLMPKNLVTLSLEVYSGTVTPRSEPKDAALLVREEYPCTDKKYKQGASKILNIYTASCRGFAIRSLLQPWCCIRPAADQFSPLPSLPTIFIQ